jgi:hypothetical protein
MPKQTLQHKQGHCPYCANRVRYEGWTQDNDLVYYNAVCDDCNLEMREEYKLDFMGTQVDNRPNSVVLTEYFDKGATVEKPKKKGGK